MKVLGLDPGTRHFGWGLIERAGTRLSHLAHGIIDTDVRAPLAERLVAIEDALVAVVDAHRPDAVSIESLFFAKDAQAAAKLGHARGVALLVCGRARIATFEYAPALVKRSIAGSGRAEKAQVAQMMRVLLKLSEVPKADATDALAIAVTHLQQEPLRAAEARAAAQAALRGGAPPSAPSGVFAASGSTKGGGGHIRRSRPV